MKLGDAVQISIGVSHLENSLPFYQKLGLEKVDQNTQPYPWALLTDGQHRILLNQDGNIYCGLSYFSADAAQRVAQLEAEGIHFLQKIERQGELHLAIFSDSDGLMVGLINQDASNIYQPPGQPVSRCGKFGEFALGVKDFTAAADFWGQRGYKQLYHSPDPYPWGIFSDEMMVLGLHQTDEFNGPAMTYFSADAPDRINQLKAAGIEFLTEDGVVKTPDGEELFLFQGEI